MLVVYDPDETETVFESRTCHFHQMNPGKSFAGCTCSSSIGSRRRAPEEIAKIKADRLRKEEDAILAKAEIIKAMRRTETAQQQHTSTETNVNEQGTEGDSGTNKAG